MATVSVRGRGVARVQPDELTVGLTVEALRPRASEAFVEASRLAEQVVSLCVELGVAAGRRATSHVSLAEQGEHTEGGWQHRGYLASSRLASSASTERFEVKIDGPVWRVAHDNHGHAEARRLAAENARRRAEEYAAVLGGRVGAIVSIADPETHPRREFEAMALRAGVMPLESGEQELVAEVDVTFQLEQP